MTLVASHRMSGAGPLHRMLTKWTSIVPKDCIPECRRSLFSSSFPACFVRGGTSNGLVIDRSVLPKDVSRWQPVLSRAMGSPDGYGRQLDGMGSGISSTSKVCVIERSTRPGIDVDYTFVQVGIKDGKLDMAGNCGNMSSAVGPIAWDMGFVSPNGASLDSATARMFNTNTAKEVHCTFRVDPKTRVFQPGGEYSIDGVPGCSSKITLSFLRPEGAKTGKALPTGRPIDRLQLSSGETFQASLVDIANPGVFVLASDLDVCGRISPDELGSNDKLMHRLEAIRQEGARMMGLDPEIQSVPKVVLLSPPSPEQTADGVHIVCRALSMQQAHKAAPLTLALNLGASVLIPGTLAALTALGVNDTGSVTIAHASGKVQVGSVIKGGRVDSAQLHRTARVLMRGDVFYTLADGH